MPADAAALARLGSDAEIVRTSYDDFPSPYTRAFALRFIRKQTPPHHNLAIRLRGRLIGVIGAWAHTDIHQQTAELSYWLGARYRNRGYGTQAVRQFLAYFQANFRVARLQAPVFSNNPASSRVLARCGFKREAILKRSVTKNGLLLDTHLWVFFPKTADPAHQKQRRR